MARVPTFSTLLPRRHCQGIHLLDDDGVEWHNLFRAPGAPTTEEIDSLREGHVSKVDYYHAKYASFRAGIHPHAIRMDSKTKFDEFLEAHAIDYAFVCIDQRRDSDSPRQDVVYGRAVGGGRAVHRPPVSALPLTMVPLEAQSPRVPTPRAVWRGRLPYRTPESKVMSPAIATCNCRK